MEGPRRDVATVPAASAADGRDYGVVGKAFAALAFAILAPVFTAVFFTLACVALLFDPIKGRGAHAVARIWGRSILLAAGAKLVIRDAGNFAGGEPRIVAANHSSYLDIPAILAAFPGQLRIIARRTLIWLPFIGWYLRLAGHFSIDREDPRQAMDLMKKIAARMRRDRLSPLLYPEGTRSKDGRLQAMKAGAFWLPITVEVPVQPVAIRGAHEILPKGAWAPRRRGTIEVRVGAAVSSEGRKGSSGRKELAADVAAALVALGVPQGSSSATAE